MIGITMRNILHAVLLVIFTGLAANAADITVFSSGVTNGGIRKLALAWSLQTGNRVTFKSGNVGDVKNNVETDIPGDIALLLTSDVHEVSSKLKPETITPIGRALFGLSVKAGSPHPDISTIKKFATVLRASGGIGYPTGTSLSGTMVAKMLTRPEFKGIKGLPLRANAASVVSTGLAQYGGGTASEELSDPGAELAGVFPAGLDMHIDFTAAVIARTSSPADAESFLHFITSHEAMLDWHDCGIDGAGQEADAPRRPCAVVAPTIEPAPSNDEVRAPRPLRTRGVPLALAVEGAQTAVAACLVNNYKVTALVTDSGGIPIAMLSGDGAAAITQRIAMGKAQTVLKFNMSSGQAADRAKTDAAFLAQLTADPLVGPPRQGGIPIMVGSDMIGAFAVSGAPSGDKDEPCAMAGLSKIQDRLK